MKRVLGFMGNSILVVDSDKDNESENLPVYVKDDGTLTTVNPDEEVQDAGQADGTDG